ncbi:MAG: MarR family transcriptional regulator [Spirochaetaceae bacterium]|nr:MAG: MarR family transcriptional regulator [Spirochaetaceae bacterium]
MEAAQASRSDEVLATLRRIIRALELHSKQLSKYVGLTGPQLVVLREIGALPESSVGNIARKVSLSHATVTRIIDRLEEKQLAIRLRSQTDKRRVTLQVTESGRAILDAHPSYFQERFVKDFEQLADWEKTLILSSLQRVASMLSDPVTTASGSKDGSEDAALDVSAQPSEEPGW